MRPDMGRIALCLSLALLLGGCLSPAPLTRFHTLSPVDGPAVTAKNLDGVVVREVRVPGYADRPQVVIRRTAHGQVFSEFAQWGHPLRDDLARTMTANLQQRLPGTPILMAPLANPPAAWPRLIIDVREFDLAANGAVNLRAQWILSDATTGSLRTGTAAFHGQAEDSTGDVESLIAAISPLWGELADRIASDLARWATP